jgi:hypothetical protein
MAKRLNGVFLAAAFMGTLLFAACSDDDPSTSGGEAGDASGGGADGGSGGSGTSGSMSHEGGDAGAGHAGEGPVAGSGGTGGTSGGGTGGAAGEAGATMGDGGMAGAGGSGEPGLMFTCGQSTIVHEFCSGAVSLNCADQSSCPDCVAERAADRDTFAECATCLAKYDEALQCAIDAFKAGDATAGYECVPEFGADLKETTCAGPFFDAYDCTTYLAQNPCPAQWPPVD